MSSQTRTMLEDALRRINEKRNKLMAKIGGPHSIVDELDAHEELEQLGKEARRIKRYLRDEYGELRSLESDN